MPMPEASLFDHRYPKLETLRNNTDAHVKNQETTKRPHSLLKKPIVSVTYENETILIKKQVTLLKMCVTSLLYGPWADLRSFH